MKDLACDKEIFDDNGELFFDDDSEVLLDFVEKELEDHRVNSLEEEDIERQKEQDFENQWIEDMNNEYQQQKLIDEAIEKSFSPNNFQKSSNKIKKKTLLKKKENQNKLMFEAVVNADIEKIQKALDNGAVIDYQDESGWTALMTSSFCVKKDIVEFLLNNGANYGAQCEGGNTALVFAAEFGEEKIIDLLVEAYQGKTGNKRNDNQLFRSNSYPQKLVKILTNFRKDTPIKYTTHLWDMNFSEEYGDFDGYIAKVREDWDKIESDLKNLSPNIYNKIYNFLLNEKADKNWCSKEGDDICIGWSSLDGLREWCDEGNEPFSFQLEKSYQIEGKTITSFGEVINIFKQEIQIRNENNILEKIFRSKKKELLYECSGVFEIETLKIKGKSFYTDVEKFKNVIDRIFSEIKK